MLCAFVFPLLVSLASVPVHTSPAGPLQSPQALPALPSQNPPGYEVIKQVVREYIIDEKGNEIVREYERPLDQPPLRVPTGAVWGGQSAAEKPESRAVKETGSALDNVTTGSVIPARTDYRDADSTTEFKQSEGAQSKTSTCSYHLKGCALHLYGWKYNGFILLV